MALAHDLPTLTRVYYNVAGRRAALEHRKQYAEHDDLTSQILVLGDVLDMINDIMNECFVDFEDEVITDDLLDGFTADDLLCLDDDPEDDFPF